MNKKIICEVNPSMFKQIVLFYEDEELVGDERIPFSDLVNYLITTCYAEQCYDLHLFGNWSYLEGIIQNINTQEATQYNIHRINIEVNK